MLFATERRQRLLLPWLLLAPAVLCTDGCKPRHDEPVPPTVELRGEPIVPLVEAPAITPTESPSTNEPSLTIVAAEIPGEPPLTVGIPQLSLLPPTDYPKGFIPVGFDALGGFEFVLPEGGRMPEPDPADEPTSQIPASIRALNEKPVALRGFMLPLKVNVRQGIVTEMLLMKDQSMCCFGTTPKINEWVNVRLTEERGVRAVLDEPVTIYGKLKVGEVGENGYLVGIYEMEGEGMIRTP